jgi:uncharacterized protein (UPF0332 family)
MGLTDEERQIIVQLELEKAQSIMAQIENLRVLKYWDNIANRLYYAIFHAVSALLINDGHSVNTHKGVVVLFGQHYVRTNIFSMDDGKLYSQLQTMREKGDYNCAYQTSEDEIEPLIEPTQILVDKIVKYISK